MDRLRSNTLIFIFMALAICGCDSKSKNAKSWNIRGGTLMDRGKLQEAITCFDKAIESNAEYALAWSNKGAALAC